MRNAADELLKKIDEVGLYIECIKISIRKEAFAYPEEYNNFVLYEGFSDDQFASFIRSIRFEYDPYYTDQKIYGNVWFTDGTWLERRSNDASEWWCHVFCPEKPKENKK